MNKKKQIQYKKNIQKKQKTVFPEGLLSLNLTADMFHHNVSDTKYYEKWGFARSELFSLFMTITLFVYPRLIEFRRTLMSYPGEFKSVDEWYTVLDKMILSFKYIIEDEYCINLNTNQSVIDIVEKNSPDITDDFTKKYFDNDVYENGLKIGTEEYNKYRTNRDNIINEGLSLFSKYFLGLWD